MSSMRGAHGFSVVELLVAVAVLLLVSGAVIGMLQRALGATPVLEETTDLHQRARVAADAIGGELRAAAAGTASGVLRVVAGIDPRLQSDPAGSAWDRRLTLRYVPDNGAAGVLASDLLPGAPVAAVDVARCALNTVACGFGAAALALVFDASGNADLLQVLGVAPGALTIADVGGARSASYPAGSEIVELSQVGFAFDPAARQLRRLEGSGNFVLVDNVTGGFSYYGDGMAAIPLSALQDGPFVGSGDLLFDADIRRVRTVRVAIRVETGMDAMRGTDPRFFARPGSATSERTIADLVTTLDVAVRNGGL